MKILLAEDDANISFITQVCLERFGGHEVILCQDGEAALHRARSESFDLILLDGMMPKKSGLEVALILKKENPNLAPIIFLSAKSDQKDIALFLTHGEGYIPKPFDPQKISEQIDQLLNQSLSRAA